MRSYFILLSFLLFALCIKSQEIENIKASYKNDTLTIFYDLTGKTRLDSIEAIVSSFKTHKKYYFLFQGDIEKGIEIGKGKKVWTYVHRDSFPQQGESLKIGLRGWTKETTKLKKSRSFFDFSMKTPVNPRFSFTPTVGIIYRSSEFSKVGQKFSGIFYYQTSSTFQIGLGVNHYNFLDSIKHFRTVHGMISTKYSLSNYSLPVYLVMNYGYCMFNEGPVITAGVGYKDVIYGPFNIEVRAQLHKFYGDFDFYALSLNAGISIDAHSRKRYKREKLYKFKDFMIYVEGGVNYFTKLSPSLSVDFTYKIAPNYTQGIGVSFDAINYKFAKDYETTYYSDYYKKNIEYVAGIADYELKIQLIPVYLNGRLYLSSGNFRPYLLWKYGFTLYSNVDNGDIKNGFVGDLGLGFQSPINKKKALTFSAGLKFFDNNYSYAQVENNFFGTIFLKTGIVF